MVTPQIDEIGRIIGDPSRAAMLVTMLDGRAWTGRQLAAAVHVTPPTASEHLKRLVDAGFVSVVRQGRSSYFRLASADIAQMLESLMVVAPQQPRRNGRAPAVDADLREARTCYDHLAGELGVAIADALIRAKAVVLSDEGTMARVDDAFFAARGIVPPPNSRREACRLCLDWTERRFHIGGRAGAAIAAHAFDRGWIRRREKTRAITVTESGRDGLRAAFELNWKDKP